MEKQCLESKQYLHIKWRKEKKNGYARPLTTVKFFLLLMHHFLASPNKKKKGTYYTTFLFDESQKDWKKLETGNL